jgi:hypothetical protein
MAGCRAPSFPVLALAAAEPDFDFAIDSDEKRSVPSPASEETQYPPHLRGS